MGREEASRKMRTLVLKVLRGNFGLLLDIFFRMGAYAL